jgi:sortase A
LKIPRLGYDEIVLEGASARILAFGPARLLSSARPEEPGNLAVAGHRTSWFRRLEEIRAGDKIEVQWYDVHSRSLHERDFKVDAIHIVKPDDVELLAPTADDALTLITCFPFGPSPRSPQRYVVRAVPSDVRLASE